MRKLLSANFRRLWRSKALWLIVLGVVLFSLYIAYQGGDFARSRIERGLPADLELFYFQFVPFTGILYGLLIRLFSDPEHHEGTLRNKLIVGHSRRDIFLSNYIVNFTGCCIVLTAFFLFGLLELYSIGPFALGTEQLLFYYLIAFGMTASFAAIYTWITTASTNPTLTALYVGLVWAAMILLASGLYDRLSELEMTGGASGFVMAFVDGEFVEMPSEPNPRYLSGWVRTVCEFVLDALPTGQGILMSEVEIAHPIRELVSSLVITTVALAGGVFHFNRKDLK